MDLKLHGKRAIVTGASRGIGRCCALALAREGARVCISARNRDLLDEVVREIEAAGGAGHAVTADLTSLDDCRKVVLEAADTFGGIDILVNCAGAARGGDILELPTEQIDEGLALKAHGYLRMSQLVIPYMQENRWGRIVHIAGSAGTSPSRGNIPLSVANIAVLNFTRALTDAVSGDGILVNAICPGMTNTKRARDLQQAEADRQGRDVEELLREAGERIPAGRIAEPEEVAAVVTFLVSEPCSYVFGTAVYMDGGERRGTP
ncbi:MAG: SDR family oxidoreductase [Gemmatimonadetes bacterium]|nr:SDR family oxidoreductase [Gemmatimonadota bacterium]